MQFVSAVLAAMSAVKDWSCNACSTGQPWGTKQQQKDRIHSVPVWTRSVDTGSEVRVMSLPASIGSHKLSQIILFSLVNNS